MRWLLFKFLCLFFADWTCHFWEAGGWRRKRLLSFSVVVAIAYGELKPPHFQFKSTAWLVEKSISIGMGGSRKKKKSPVLSSVIQGLDCRSLGMGRWLNAYCVLSAALVCLDPAFYDCSNNNLLTTELQNLFQNVAVISLGRAAKVLSCLQCRDCGGRT